MGILNYFAISARKSSAASGIESILTHYKKSHVFDGDPKSTAERIIRHSLSVLPELIELELETPVFIAGALTMELIRMDADTLNSPVYNLALGTVLQSLTTPEKFDSLTLRERKLIEAAFTTYINFSEGRPSHIELRRI